MKSSKPVLKNQEQKQHQQQQQIKQQQHSRQAEKPKVELQDTIVHHEEAPQFDQEHPETRMTR